MACNKKTLHFRARFLLVDPMSEISYLDLFGDLVDMVIVFDG